MTRNGRQAGTGPEVRTHHRASLRFDGGFTLVEMTTSVAVMLIVLTAAWMLLTVTNANLNAIDYGGQSSEINRAALAEFERDLNHSVLPQEDMSPVLYAGDQRISFLADPEGEHEAELVTWTADDSHRLLRVVTEPNDDVAMPRTLADFSDGVSTTETVLTGLVDGSMFSYAADASTPYDPANGVGMNRIGLVTFRLRNGLPDEKSYVTDRTGAFRILSLVINGY